MKLLVLKTKKDPKYLPSAIKQLCNAWARSKAWKVDMSGISLTIEKDYTNTYSTGQGTVHSIKICLGTNQADAFATLMHEMAHVAAMRHKLDYGHGLYWQISFLKFAEHVLKEDIIVKGYSGVNVHQAIAKAIARKFKLRVPRSS